jgi:hypothetical protein
MDNSMQVGTKISVVTLDLSGGDCNSLLYSVYVLLFPGSMEPDSESIHRRIEKELDAETAVDFSAGKIPHEISFQIVER